MKTKLPSSIYKSFLILGLLLVFSASKAQIASWTYEPLQGTNANPTSNVGSGTSAVINPNPATELISPGTAVGMDATTGSGCGAQNGVTAWALNPFNSGTSNESNGVQYNASTVGNQNIIFTWDQRWSNTAANTLRVQYTTDGTTWTNFIMTNPGNTTFCSGSINGNGCFETNTSGDEFRRISVNFSAISAVNNNPNFGVRILASYYQATTDFRQTAFPTLVANPLGTWRFDNVSISGTPIPPPTSITLSGTSPTTICAGASTNIVVTFTGGTGPFTLTYTDNVSGANTVISNYVSGTSIPVTPASTRTYTIVSLAHAGGTVNSGITYVTNTITVNVLPTIGLAPTATSVCFSAGAQTTSLTYAGTTGTPSLPNKYGIVWNASPANSFVAVPISTNLPASPITINIPAGTPPGTYTGNLTVKFGIAPSSCSSISKSFTVTVTSTVITSQPSTTPQTTCSDSVFTPISVGATGSGLTYQWYINYLNSNVGGTLITGATSASYTPLTSASIPLHIQAFYYYYAIVSSGFCSPVKSAVSGAFTVDALSVAGSVAGAQTICAGTTPSNLVLSGQTGTVVKWERANDVGFTTGLADIASTATTLIGATIGTLTQTTYFRAYVKNGSCSTVTTTPIQVLIKSTTWTAVPGPAHWSSGAPDSVTTAIFDTDYSSAGNVSACSVQVTSGNIVFNANDVLTIQNGLTITGGTLTFENNASLVQVNSTTNVGSITYKRNTTPVRKFDYTYWSSPVDFQILASFSPLTLSDKYFWFNTTIYNWNAVAAPGFTGMDIGKGYIIRAPQTFDPVATTVFNGAFYGVPNNGDYSIPIVYTDATHDLNCIGNPYPSALSADAFIDGNASTFGTGTTLYFWTHNSPITNNAYVFSDYAAYNYTGGVGGSGTPVSGGNNTTPSGKIAAGQAFMIKARASGTATFRNSMRLSTNNNEFFRVNQNANATQSFEKNRVWLDFKNDQGAFKQTLVGYVQNATNEFDFGYDGEFLDGGNSVNFYSLLNGTKLSIQGKGLPFVESDQVALGYKTTAAGSYEIALSQEDGLFSNQGVFLEDNLLSITHNLKESPYSFVSEMGTFDTRFVLKYANSSLGTTNSIMSSDSVIVYKNGNKIVIQSSNIKLQDINIYDISGRLLYTKHGIHNNEIVVAENFTHEVILVEIVSDNHQKVIKKLVN